MFKTNPHLGYYDPYPVAELDRHIALIGLSTEETRTVGFRLAGLLGASAADSDRLIEHDTGTSVWNLIWREGEAHYRKLERKHLYRAISARPFGVISLGDGALIHPGTRAKVASFCHLVALDRDLAGCYWHIRSTETAEMDYWHPLFSGRLQTFEQVRPFYEARRPGIDEAATRIAVVGQSPSSIAQQLFRELVD